MKIKKTWKAIRKSFLFADILYILLGLAAVIWPKYTQTIICYAFGGIVLFYGLIHVVSFFNREDQGMFSRFNLLIGIISGGIGIFMLIQPKVVLSILPFILGVAILFNSFSSIKQALDLRRSEYGNWWVALLLAFVTMGLGVLLLFNPFGAAALLMIVIGICLIFEGVSDIWIVSRVSKNVKQMKKDLDLIETQGEEIDQD